MIQRLAQDREPEVETPRDQLRSRLNESKTNDTVYCEDQSQLALLTDDGKILAEGGPGDISNRNNKQVAVLKKNIVTNKDRLFKMFGGENKRRTQQNNNNSLSDHSQTRQKKVSPANRDSINKKKAIIPKPSPIRLRPSFKLKLVADQQAKAQFESDRSFL